MSDDGVRVQVYSTDHCVFCLRAKALLELRGVDYEETYVPRTDREAYRAMVEQTGHMSFPAILVDGQLIGGFDSLIDFDRQGGLRVLARH